MYLTNKEKAKYRGNGLADPWECPDCKDTVTDFPALSRKDNETEICSDCGTREALEDYYGLPYGSTLESNGKDIAYKIRKALVRL